VTTERIFTCAPRLELRALPGLPVLQPGDDLAAMVAAGLRRAEITLAEGDVLVVASKAVSRAEGRFVDLCTIEPGAKARELAETVQKDARLVELILRESSAISRAAPNVLVVRHRTGVVGANAGIDASNARPENVTGGEWVLILPESPDASAARLREALAPGGKPGIGVVISDSLGRPFRLGTVGAAIGVAGLPALSDRRGELDLFGRALEQTITAPADQIAAAADLVAGQAGEGRAVVHVRGLSFEASAAGGVGELYRDPEKDLYR
jgi:coenzyme F420-0:L-glutamate ligase/coenzyme F420-1:gamma-L-glutamate ligase